jgi:mandelate racemase
MNIAIRAVRATPVIVPFRRPPLTASGPIKEVALVLLDIECDADLVGHAYLLTFLSSMLKPTVECVHAVAQLVAGKVASPEHVDAQLRAQLRLLDLHGILGQVLAGINMALWDVKAKAADLPLVNLLGVKHKRVRAYNSCGLWLRNDNPESLADECEELLAEGGYKGIKLRIGYASPEDDLKAIRVVRNRLNSNVCLMSDFNQSLEAGDALRRCRLLDDEGLYWIEEPIRYDDYALSAKIATEIKTPLQTGENLLNPIEFQKAICSGISDYYMLDVQRMAGVSGWVTASRLPEAREIQISSHLFPEISVHLLAAAGNAHWLEFVDWAHPVIQDPARVEGGFVAVSDRVGNGIEWDREAVKRYMVQ